MTYKFRVYDFWLSLNDTFCKSFRSNVWAILCVLLQFSGLHKNLSKSEWYCFVLLGAKHFQDQMRSSYACHRISLMKQNVVKSTQWFNSKHPFNQLMYRNVWHCELVECIGDDYLSVMFLSTGYRRFWSWLNFQKFSELSKWRRFCRVYSNWSVKIVTSACKRSSQAASSQALVEQTSLTHAWCWVH
jgi:hypothetical protein